MGLFTKLFGRKQAKDAMLDISLSSHEAGEGDCLSKKNMCPVSIPGPPPQDAFGFFNLGVYRVTGHIMNQQTNRPNKKSVKVHALSISDAESAASELGILPPFSVVVVDNLNTPPNEYQISNAKEYGITIPAGAVDADVRTMVERCDRPSPSPEFALYCTHHRILFSRYIDEQELVNRIYPTLSDRDKIALFAHAVHCVISGQPLGNPENDPVCYSFADKADSSAHSEVLKRGVQDLPTPRRGTKAWNVVCAYDSSLH